MEDTLGTKPNILVVGAGFAGATAARQLADNGYQVTVIDERDHVGGNAYDYVNEHGIRIHKYGPHIFHTSNDKIYEWLSRFTEWIPYKHKVNALLTDGNLVPFPINSDTLQYVDEADLIEVFFKPYSMKMWGIEFDQLDHSVIKRVPIKKDSDPYYFNDKYQGMPLNGYTALIENMLDSKSIEVHTSTTFDIEMERDFYHCFNSSAIDRYYNYCYGRLPYRSIKFNTITMPTEKIFPTSVVNFTDQGPSTRVTEWKNFPNHGKGPRTTLTFEEPCDYLDNNEERYYPIKNRNNIDLYNKYKDIPNTKTTFIGRCGLYVYIDMDQAASSTIASVDRLIKETS